jgi:hypothetical protein
VTELLHGYTLADLQRCARIAATSAGMFASDAADRYEVALSGIAEYLYSAEHPPREHQLVSAGRETIWEEAKATLRHCGYTTPNQRATHGSGTAPRFTAYWDAVSAPADSHEERLVERVALAQIMPALTPRQREIVGALAAFDGYRAAADALAMQYKTYAGYLAEARRRFLRLWHEGETPSRMWSTDHRNGGDEARSGRRAMYRLRARTGTRINQVPSPDLLPVHVGARCGSLTVLEGRRRGATKLLCRCDCGTERPFLIANLRRGASQSCGCPAGRAAAAERNRVRREPVPGGGVYARTRSAARAVDLRAA